MLKDQWEELMAQVESHGSNAIRLFDEEGIEYTVTDVVFDDDVVVVRIEEL